MRGQIKMFTFQMKVVDHNLPGTAPNAVSVKKASWAQDHAKPERPLMSL